MEGGGRRRRGERMEEGGRRMDEGRAGEEVLNFDSVNIQFW